MKLKKIEAAGSRMAVNGGVLVVDKDGVVEVENKSLCKILIGQGWSIVASAKKVEPKKEEPKKELEVEEPKVEEPKIEAPKHKGPKRKFKRSGK